MRHRNVHYYYYYDHELVHMLTFKASLPRKVPSTKILYTAFTDAICQQTTRITNALYNMYHLPTNNTHHQRAVQHVPSANKQHSSPTCCTACTACPQMPSSNKQHTSPTCCTTCTICQQTTLITNVLYNMYHLPTNNTHHQRAVQHVQRVHRCHLATNNTHHQRDVQHVHRRRVHRQSYVGYMCTINGGRVHQNQCARACGGVTKTTVQSNPVQSSIVQQHYARPTWKKSFSSRNMEHDLFNSFLL